MKNQPKFLIAATLVVGLVGYLMVTGMKDSFVYYYTPTELVQKSSADPSFHDVGVKVGGRVVPGTVAYDSRTLDLHFELVDIEGGDAVFPVTYTGPLPETFEEGADVVVEGRYTAEGVFAANTVLTKCGSRYEAGVDEYLQQEAAR